MGGSENTGHCENYHVGDIPVQLTLDVRPNSALNGYWMALASAYFGVMRDGRADRPCAGLGELPQIDTKYRAA